MRLRTILLVCGLGASISACHAAKGNDVRIDRTRDTAEPLPTTFYEHQDHRDLPIGTRIFYRRIQGTGYSEEWVYPGQDGPPGRKPDIVIIE
jgi:hypothetical protein